ncbi:MAG: glycoside hydrolase family 9 protein [Ignavibacteria bacterium]|nr:glycoside hydrolase family 9 protein [Ignavibacteria bacterium]
MQDSNGGFWGSACPGCDNYSYAYGTSFPSDVNPYCKSIPPTAQNTAKAVAVLAYASVVYAPYDIAFANGCLSAAQAGWTWMVNNPTATNDAGPCGSYQQGSDPALLKTHRMWAAAAMLYATGDPVYEAAFENDFVVIDGISSFNKSEAFAGSLYLRVLVGANQTSKNSIQQRIFTMADGVRTDASAHPFQFATAYYWGCTSNGMHRSAQFSWRAYALDTNRVADRDQALLNLDYIFGRNFFNQCYVSGIDGVSKSRVHGFHHWMKVLNADPWHFPGALAGGPNQSPELNDISFPNAQPYPIWGYWGDPANPRTSATPVDGRFTDNDSWSTNEIAINWNAALLYNLYAAKYIARGGSVNEISPDPSTIPTSVILHQNFPNPFNPSTVIRYSLPVSSRVVLKVYNLLGEKIATLVDGTEDPGFKSVEWSATGVPSGIYVYRIIAGTFTDVRKMAVIK